MIICILLQRDPNGIPYLNESECSIYSNNSSFVPHDSDFLLAMKCAPSFPPLAQHVDDLLGQEEEDKGGECHETSPDKDFVIFNLVVAAVAVTP